MVKIIKVPKDREGKYRPEFVKRMLLLEKKKSRGVVFKNSKDFLKKISVV